MALLQRLNCGLKSATITGYELMRMFKKGKFDFWLATKNMNEVQLINDLFEVNAG